MTIKQEFQNHNPSLLYVDHDFVSPSIVGISFLAVGGGRVLGGVRLYNVNNGAIDWANPVKTVESWANIERRQR